MVTKALLVLAFAALAMAGGSPCTSLANGNFDEANTIAPWLNNSYLGGSSSCEDHDFFSNNRCELLQTNIIPSGNFLSNAGRISVGYPFQTECRPDDQSAPVGVNVYQQNIGMCRGVTVRADVGFQDDSRLATDVRVPNIFSIVVGVNEFELYGGTTMELVSHTFPVPAGPPFDEFTQTTLEGVWSGRNGDSCSPVCPESGPCYAVGVRYARADIVRSRVRGYIDNLQIIDSVAPSLSVNDVSATASSCDALTFVNFDVTASDNCCAPVDLTYTWTNSNGAQSAENVAGGLFDVGTTTVTVTATKTNSLTNTATFNVFVYQYKPGIVCTDHSDTAQSCWSIVTVSSALATNSDACSGASPITYSPALDQPFPIGRTVVTASYTQSNGVDGDYDISCTAVVDITLCCDGTSPPAKRSARLGLRQLLKF